MRLVVSACCALLAALLATAPTAITAQSCSTTLQLATQLYSYAFPLLLMNATSEDTAYNGVVTSLQQNPNNHLVVKPNLDTSYTQGFFDLTNASYLVHLPAHHGRYWIAQVLDAYSNTIADPGSRTVAADVPYAMLLAGPRANLTALPTNATVVRSTTNLVWLLGRIYQNNTAADLQVVAQLAAQWTITTYPRQGSGMPSSVAVAGLILQNSSATANLTAPIVVVSQLNASQYYDRAAALMCANPPSQNDSAFLTNVAGPLGFTPCAAGAGVPTFTNATAIYSCLPSNFSAMALQYIGGQALALGANATVNTWPYVTNIGTYGTSYNLRAAIALIGLGANLPVDAIYLTGQVDSAGRHLNASLPYTLTFARGQLPPVDAFWSVTYYTSTSFLALNSGNKYAVRSADHLLTGADGSTTLYIQPIAPMNSSLDANWLPTAPGATPTFILTLRLYNPQQAAANHTWIPPAIMRQSAGI